MPRLSIYFTAERMPADDSLAALTERCAVMCTDMLGAALDNVHIVYLAARQGRAIRRPRNWPTDWDRRGRPSSWTNSCGSSIWPSKTMQG